MPGGEIDYERFWVKHDSKQYTLHVIFFSDKVHTC